MNIVSGAAAVGIAASPFRIGPPLFLLLRLLFLPIFQNDYGCCKQCCIVQTPAWLGEKRECMRCPEEHANKND